MYFAKYGDIYYMDDETSVYRLQTKGMVKSQLTTIEKNLEFIPYYKDLQKEFSEFDLDDLIDKLIARRYEKIIIRSLKQKNVIHTIKYAIIFLFSYPKNFLAMITNRLQSKVVG